jgi:hypothetical protein
MGAFQLVVTSTNLTAIPAIDTPLLAFKFARFHAVNDRISPAACENADPATFPSRLRSPNFIAMLSPRKFRVKNVKPSLRMASNRVS